MRYDMPPYMVPQTKADKIVDRAGVQVCPSDPLPTEQPSPSDVSMKPRVAQTVIGLRDCDVSRANIACEHSHPCLSRVGQHQR